MDRKLIGSYYTLRGATRVSHLLFADDVLVFANGGLDSMQALLGFIDQFCAVSGQRINVAKSSIILPERMDSGHKAALLALTGFKEEHLPITYLGVPLYKGRTKIEYFHYLVTKLQSRICSWAKKFLSMGARVTLVNSVLNSMSVHCFMALPVPSTILRRISSLLSSFVWDDGADRGRHWVAWDTLCRPKNVGGLGIRKPHDVMLALHAKLAWRFIEGTSIWATHAASRFKHDKSGSPLWNAIDHLIQSGREAGVWRIGSGNTTIKAICSKYAVLPPSWIRDLRLRDVVDIPGHLFSLLDALPSCARDAFVDVQFSHGEDHFVWRHSADGKFITKVFFHSFQTRHPTLQWAARIWKPYIPVKISCFIWKVYLNAVPTDANIRRLHISLASKCWCCSSPKAEDLHHILFAGEVASDMWRMLCTWFGRPRVFGLRGFTSIWLRGNRKSYVDSLATALACCALWELWKYRNACIHDSNRYDPKQAIKRWSSELSPLIKAPYVPSPRMDLTLASLGVRAPATRMSRSVWLKWEPPDVGTVLDCHMHHSADSRLLCSAVLRGLGGVFRLAVVWSTSTAAMLKEWRNFFEYLHSVHSIDWDQLTRIRSSVPSGRLLVAPEGELAADLLFDRRALSSLLQGRFRMVMPNQNNMAICLSHTAAPGVYHALETLPRPVRRAFYADKLGLGSPSAADFTSPSVDDLQVFRALPGLSLFHDDTRL